MSTVLRGSTLTLEFVVEPATALGPVPEVTDVLVDIINPSATEVVTDAPATEDPSPPEAGTARWTYDFVAAGDAELGEWTIHWTATVNGVGGYAASEFFEVVESLFEFAGRYSEDLQDRYGNGYRNAKVAVQTLAATPVTLYADRDRTAYIPAAGLAANEIKADSRGNLRFFADPGNYQIVVTPVGGSTLGAFPVSVFPDPLEPDASEGALAAEQEAREDADTALTQAIADEATARANADDNLSTSVAGKVSRAANLSDLEDAGAARGNLGLGDAATQDAADLPVSTAQGVALDEKVGAFGDPRQTVTIGEAVVDGDAFSVNITSPWGITAGGLPYYDPDGAAAGEDAILSLEGGAFVLTKP